MTAMKLGWTAPPPGYKPKHFFKAAPMVTLPPSTDHESYCPGVYDQGDIGSCTAQAVGAMSQFVMRKCDHKWFVPSRLAAYYWTREREGNLGQDSGASLQGTMAIFTGKGNAHESMWWYNTVKYNVKPNLKVVADAANHKVAQQLSVPNDLLHMRTCLAEGFPFVFGFLVYQSFMSNLVAQTGICPMPRPGEQQMGGHAVMAVGYDDLKGMFKVRNSWGRGWGKNGYFWMPYDYLANDNLAGDMWTMRTFSTWVA